MGSTLVQHHCWQQARHNAEWVISVAHGWDMFLYSPLGESLTHLLKRLPKNGVSYIDGVRYGSPFFADRVAQERIKHKNVLGRFPFHVDLSVCPESCDLPEERILIGPPQLVDGVVLSSVAPRIEASLASKFFG